MQSRDLICLKLLFVLLLVSQAGSPVPGMAASLSDSTDESMLAQYSQGYTPVTTPIPGYSSPCGSPGYGGYSSGTCGSGDSGLQDNYNPKSSPKESIQFNDSPVVGYPAPQYEGMHVKPNSNINMNAPSIWQQDLSGGQTESEGDSKGK